MAELADAQALLADRVLLVAIETRGELLDALRGLDAPAEDKAAVADYLPALDTDEA